MPQDPDLENLSLLLPFYVNGTLDADACARVDAALASSAELREELAEIGRLAQGVKTGGRDLGQGDNARVDRVAAKLAQDAVAAPVAAPSEKLGGMLAFLNPRSWHPAVALSLAVAAVAQAGMIANLSGENTERSSEIASLEKRLGEAEFQLASGPGGEAARNGRSWRNCWRMKG
jgi:anti-sigma factor RsiW